MLRFLALVGSFFLVSVAYGANTIPRPSPQVPAAGQACVLYTVLSAQAMTGSPSFGIDQDGAKPSGRWST